jgi:capsular polysaccharide biosynthesis protein
MHHHPAVNEDEISLKELFERIAKHKKVIVASTLAFALGAGVYSLVKEPTYAYSSCISMGITGTTNQGAQIYLETPKSAIAAISNAYLPKAIHEFNTNHKNSRYAGKDFEVKNPDESPLVCVDTTGSKAKESDLATIINSSLAPLLANNEKLSAVSATDMEANINNLMAARQNLTSSLKNLDNQKQAVLQELKLMQSKQAIISAESAALEKQIKLAQQRLPEATSESHNSGSAIAMIIQNNELSHFQQRLYQLALELRVGLPKEITALNNQLKLLERQQADINAQLRTNQSQIASAKTALAALQKTTVIRPVERSSLPVGPGKLELGLLGAFLGLFIGIGYALIKSM